MFSLEALFCSVDDFCQQFEPMWHQQLIGNGLVHRQRSRNLCLSEIMTILIGFHQSSYRNFKAYYIEKVQLQWRSAFPGLVSYGRFVEWMPSTLLPLCAYLRSCFGHCSGISFLDATSLKVCHNRRIHQHKVFKDLAARGKTSVDWFFGYPSGRLRQQVASGRQRQRGVAQLHFHTRQYRRPHPCPQVAPTTLQQSVCRQGLCVSTVSQAVDGNHRGATDYQATVQHEESLDSVE